MELERNVEDRVGCRMLVGCLCSIGSNRRNSVGPFDSSWIHFIENSNNFKLDEIFSLNLPNTDQSPSLNTIGSQLFALTYDDKWLFVGGRWDGRLTIYNMYQSKIHALLTSPHIDTISCVAMDSAYSLIDRQPFTYHGDFNKINKFLIDQYKNSIRTHYYIITGSRDGTCAIWDFDILNEEDNDDRDRDHDYDHDHDRDEEEDLTEFRYDHSPFINDSLLSSFNQRKLLNSNVFFGSQDDLSMNSDPKTIHDEQDQKEHSSYYRSFDETGSSPSLSSRLLFNTIYLPKMDYHLQYRNAGIPFYPFHSYKSKKSKRLAKIIKIFYGNLYGNPVTCVALNIPLDTGLMATNANHDLYLFSVKLSNWSRVLKLNTIESDMISELNYPFETYPNTEKIFLHTNRYTTVNHLLISPRLGLIYIQWNVIIKMNQSNINKEEIGPKLSLFNSIGEKLLEISPFIYTTDYNHISSNELNQINVTQILLTSTPIQSKCTFHNEDNDHHHNTEEYLDDHLNHSISQHILMSFNTGHFMILMAETLVPIYCIKLNEGINNLSLLCNLSSNHYLMEGIHLMLSLMNNQLVIFQTIRKKTERKELA
ncbi:unnamed protein product [Schistosoma margrebowiei]|uniref:Uncharacterized protein n=1 Tax=Schistosoma margrebowiei TaxID=48269 RepID=A0AA85A100_9TREM|nr:unnamed protein product [Schistosoma margrebowiei]